MPGDYSRYCTLMRPTAMFSALFLISHPSCAESLHPLSGPNLPLISAYLQSSILVLAPSCRPRLPPIFFLQSITTHYAQPSCPQPVPALNLCGSPVSCPVSHLPRAFRSSSRPRCTLALTIDSSVRTTMRPPAGAGRIDSSTPVGVEPPPLAYGATFGSGKECRR